MLSMDNAQTKYWLAAKRYGWGWGLPPTWRGWAVMIVWILLMIAISLLAAAIHLAWFYAFVTVMVMALVAICYAKGEPPRWRWG